MRITEIAIDGFGIFYDFPIRDLDPGITVFEGRNEAGKTTLMAFIRAVLFGFEDRRSGNNRYEPVHGGRHGGALVLMTEEGKGYRVERTEGGAHGRLTVYDPDGSRADEALLQRLLYGTSKAFYQNVFAFGISELQRLDTLQAAEVSSHIYTVGMGAGLTPLATVIATLKGEQGQLFKPGGKKPTINALLHQLEETQQTIRGLQTLPDEYYTICEQLTAADREIKQFQEQLEDAKRKVEWLEALVRARPNWEELTLVHQELKDLPRIDTFPEGGVERLEQVERDLASLDTRLDRTRRALREAEERGAGLRPDLVLEHCGRSPVSLSDSPVASWRFETPSSKAWKPTRS